MRRGCGRFRSFTPIKGYARAVDDEGELFRFVQAGRLSPHIEMQLISSAPTPPPLPPYRAPVPVLPLAYAQAHVETNLKRPARLLVIGIISWLIGLLTVLGNGILTVVLCRGYANSIPP